MKRARTGLAVNRIKYGQRRASKTSFGRINHKAKTGVCDSTNTSPKDPITTAAEREKAVTATLGRRSPQRHHSRASAATDGAAKEQTPVTARRNLRRREPTSGAGRAVDEEAVPQEACPRYEQASHMGGAPKANRHPLGKVQKLINDLGRRTVHK